MANYHAPSPETPRNRGEYDAPHTSPVTPAEDFRSVLLNRVSMGAVFSGVAVALVVQLILNLLGVGIGIAAVPETTTDGTVSEGYAWGTAVWWIVAGIVSSFLGGMAAGRLSGEPRETSAGWHGIISWAASVLVIASLAAAGAGVVLSGTLGSVGGITIVTDDGRVITDATGSPAQDYPPPVTVTPQAGEEDINTGQGMRGEGAAVETSPSTIAAASLFSALALILGGIAAWYGGVAGVVKPTVTRKEMRRNLH